VVVIYEYSTIGRQNDQFIEWFLSLTRNPEIRIIEKPDDLDVIAGFGTKAKLRYTQIPDRYELEGAHFPPAVMSIRWLPKAARANWPPKSKGE
jgi:hypothetical protein